MEEKVIIGNEIGLHARLASKFVSLSNSYNSDIYVVKDGKTFNGKSLISVMSMGASNGDTILIQANGEDCENAIRDLSTLVASK